jgi:hypothetical protein
MSKKSNYLKKKILTIGKTGNSRSGIRFQYFIFEISGKPSFVEAVLWRKYAVFLHGWHSVSDDPVFSHNEKYITRG